MSLFGPAEPYNNRFHPDNETYPGDDTQNDTHHYTDTDIDDDTDENALFDEDDWNDDDDAYEQLWAQEEEEQEEEPERYPARQQAMPREIPQNVLMISEPWEDEDHFQQLKTDELMALFVELRAQGKTLRQCMPILGKSLGTLSHWNTKCAKEIDAARAEHISRAACFSKEQGVQFYKTMMQRVEAAMLQKEMSFLSIHELSHLMQQFTQGVNTHLNRPGF